MDSDEELDVFFTPRVTKQKVNFPIRSDSYNTFQSMSSTNSRQGSRLIINKIALMKEFTQYSMTDEQKLDWIELMYEHVVSLGGEEGFAIIRLQIRQCTKKNYDEEIEKYYRSNAPTPGSWKKFMKAKFISEAGFLEIKQQLRNLKRMLIILVLSRKQRSSSMQLTTLEVARQDSLHSN